MTTSSAQLITIHTTPGELHRVAEELLGAFELCNLGEQLPSIEVPQKDGSIVRFTIAQEDMGRAEIERERLRKNPR